MEFGRHAALRWLCSKGRGGSSPLRRTKNADVKGIWHTSLIQNQWFCGFDPHHPYQHTMDDVLMLFYYLSMLMPFSLLLLKHLLVDFFFQTPYMATNKGKYGHWGGISHALLHSLGALIAVLVAYVLSGMPMQFFIQWMVLATLGLALFDGVVHYHMDWFKTWWNKKKNYKSHPDLGCTMKQCRNYWKWLGIDQTVHTLTYLIMWAFMTGWVQVGVMYIRVPPQ